MRAAPVASVATALLLLLPAPAAFAAGSDDPTPYDVAADGLTLPQGDTFDDGGHVNVRYTVDGVEHSTGVHFESRNDQPSGQFVGASYLPWDFVIDAESYCVTWVQVSDYDEHFGEGGQKPVCSAAGTPASSAPASPDAAAEAPSAEAGTPADEAAAPAASAEPVASSATDAATPAASATPVAAAAPSPSATAVATVDGQDSLPWTGATAVPLLAVAGALILGGAALLVMRARERRLAS